MGSKLIYFAVLKVNCKCGRSRCVRRRVWKGGINDIGVVVRGGECKVTEKYFMAFSQFWKSDGGGGSDNEVFPLEGRERA